MDKVATAPRWQGSVTERVHAFEIEIYCSALSNLYLLRELTPEQMKLRDELRVVLAAFEVPFA